MGLRIKHVIMQPVLVYDDGQELTQGPRSKRPRSECHRVPNGSRLCPTQCKSWGREHRRLRPIADLEETRCLEHSLHVRSNLGCVRRRYVNEIKLHGHPAHEGGAFAVYTEPH